MTDTQDLDAVRAELSRRIASRERRAGAPELAADLDAIRLMAHRAGLDPAVTVTHFLASALARGEGGALITGWLPVLADAVRSERRDVAACNAYAAACSVRLAS